MATLQVLPPFNTTKTRKVTLVYSYIIPVTYSTYVVHLLFLGEGHLLCKIDVVVVVVIVVCICLISLYYCL